MAPTGCWLRCKLPEQCSVARLALVTALVACITLVSLTFDASKIEGLLVWVQENKGQGSVLFLGLYTMGVVLMFPAMVMAMAAGAIFGLLAGTALAWLGSSLGQTIAFVLGRYLLRQIVLLYLTKSFPNWTAVDRAMETEGWKLVTLLRLSPIAPWNILNWACSVTSVPLLDYTVASSFAIVPYLLLFVYFGSVARNMADIFSGKAGLDSRWTLAVAVAGGISMVAVVWYTTHISRKAIARALHSEVLAEEIVHDDEIADLLRVTSSQLSSGVERGDGTAHSSAHATSASFTKGREPELRRAQRSSLSAPASRTTSPRLSDIEMAVLLASSDGRSGGGVAGPGGGSSSSGSKSRRGKQARALGEWEELTLLQHTSGSPPAIVRELLPASPL